MQGAMVQPQTIQGRGTGLRQIVQPALNHRAVQEGECQEKAVARQRFNGPTEVESVTPRPHRRHGLHPARRHPTAQEGLEAKAGLILGEDFYREPSVMAREWLGERGGQGRWDLVPGVRTLFCGRAVGVSV
jgi:hypothetical protein